MKTKPVEPVAIIGMGCRFPGAPNVPAFWRMMCDGVDAVREVPPERWDRDAFYDPHPAVPGKTVSRWGGFVDDIEGFDPFFFGISPRNAIRTDPQQRMLLEAAWEAMESAGLRLEQLNGANGGVFLGLSTDDYLTLERNDPKHIDIYTGIGGNRGAAAGRLTYFFGLNGPSCAVDTACSSSLVALHLACNALRAGDCDLAFAGGSNAILHPLTAIAFSQGGMLSPDGRCQAFDSRANGFVRSEGAGIVILKPLARALADGDPIQAVIRGSAMNNDGASSPMMTPSRFGQETVLRAAYESAGVSPTRVQYVEAHGTGTAVGDPVEMGALGAVLGEGRDPERPCHIGSSKTNLGHMEAGAGAAGLIKTILCLQRRMIPPNLHCQSLNPSIPWDTLPFLVQRELGAWPDTDGGLALAGVNSFGITGTNVHVVLEEAPPRPAPQAPPDAVHLLALSAQSPDALKATARAYRTWLTEEAAPETLHDICYSADARRTHHDHRLALVAQDREELVEQLDAFLEGESRAGLRCGQKAEGRGPVFVFSGVGSQWIGMGRALRREEPVFRDALERCDRAFQALAGGSVIDAIDAPEGSSRLEEVEVMQPAVFSMQVALAALWQSWGIRPAAVVGHSLGECAAAHVAGVLTLEEAARAVYHRCRLMQRTEGQGRMLAVELSMEAALEAVQGYEGRVEVAVWNSPTSCVLSGEPAALEEIEGRLRGQSLFCRYVRAGVAFHSPQMAPLMDELAASLEGIQPGPESVPIFSSVTARRESGLTFDASYWVANMRGQVRFAPTVQALLAEGFDTFLEVSPHPVLLTPIRQGAGQAATTLGSLQRDRDERATLLATLGALYCAGSPVEWAGLFPGGGKLIAPPPYPWQRERVWFSEETRYFSGFAGQARRTSSHPLFVAHWESAQHPGTHFWEGAIDVEKYPYLKDHSLQGTPLLPAAAYLEMALAASLEAFGPGPRTLRRVRLHRPLFLSGETKRLQLVLSPELPGTYAFRFYHLNSGTWDLQVDGEVRLRDEELELPFSTDISCEALAAQLPPRDGGADFYARSRIHGLDYGPAFQGVEQSWREGEDGVVVLHTPEPIVHAAAGYQIHPSLLDCILQSYLAVTDSNRAAALPVGIDGFHFVRMPVPGERLWCRVHSVLLEDGREGCLAVYDEQGHLIATESGHRGKIFARESGPADETADWLYETAWEEKERTPPAPAAPGRWLVLSDGDEVGEQLVRLLRAQGEECLAARPGWSRSEMADLLRRFQQEGARPWRGIVDLGALSAPSNSALSPEALDEAEKRLCGSVLHLVQALSEISEAPRLWLVTRGAQAVHGEAPALAQAPLLGLARVAATEHPKLRVTRVDLDPSGDGADSLCDEIRSGDEETEVALRGETRLVARLSRSEANAAPVMLRRKLGKDDNCRLDTAGDGTLDHLALQAMERSAPGTGELEIEVVTVGLNFLDVLRALNTLPGQPPGPAMFGLECAGRVVSVGEGVTDFKPGDEVMAMNAGGSGCFRRFLTIEARKAFKKPPHLTFEEAATIPVAYQTAWYALHYLGRMRKGESVLIHCAAGGVGLAAVEIALQAGAVVYATAGSPEKREFVKSLGARHVMNSRNLDFAHEIMEVTDGRGVDLVLNSLAGEAIPRSLGVLATGGRFLEIGKRDIYGDSRIGLLPFQRNLSFYAIDLFRLALERPDVLEEVTAQIVDRIDSGAFKPLPHRVFPVSQVADAFRYMAQGKHTGKIVIGFEDAEAQVESPIYRPVRDDATYLITGGLGALGLAFARRLIDQGARNVALVGRRSPSPEIGSAIDALREMGARVETFAADVSKPSDVASMLSGIRTSMPALRGVLHAAGTLSDGILQKLDWAQFETVFAPKVRGAWNLHAALEDEPLDFFVMFSSAATTFGATGQGNYAAANAFLDALAHYRRERGLPALSVSWGPWADIGMASRPDRGERLAAGGRGSIPPAQGTALLDRLLARGVPHVTVAPVDWQKWQASHPGITRLPLLAHFARNGHSAGAAESTLPSDQPSLEAYLRKVIARVLKLSEARLDATTTLNRLGLDSLMAVELKNRIENDLSITLPVVKLLEGPSVGQLAAWLYSQVSGRDAAVAEPTPLHHEDLTADEQPRLSDIGVPVSYGQQRLWFVDQVSPGDPCYNICVAVRLEGVLDVAAVERAYNEIVRRHEVLRTRFTTPREELVTGVDPQAVVSVPVISVEHLPVAQREAEAHRLAVEEARRPFDLAQAPLIRCMLLRLSEIDQVLVTTIHHIACDAWSWGVLANEFPPLYAGEVLPELPVQYADYARWQRERLQGETLDHQLQYWRERLSGAPPLELPTDRPRPPVASHDGGHAAVSLPASTVEALKALGQSEDATLFMVLLAGFQALLARESGQEDLLVGCPISSRDHVDLSGLIGFFVNTLVIRNDLSGNPTFGEVLSRTREACLGAYANQDVPFERLVEELKPRRDPSRNPIFQVAMALQKVPYEPPTLPGLVPTRFPVHNGTSKFDLFLELTDEADGGLTCALEYSTDLYEEASACALLERLVALLTEVARDPSVRPCARRADLEMAT